jgi:hypothetical protein
VEFKRKSENTEARREHCQDCVYFRVRGLLGGVVDDLSWTIIRDRFYNNTYLLSSSVKRLQRIKMFRKELLKHVDYGNNHRRVLNNLKTVFPGRTFVDNPEFMGSSQGDGHQGGWRETISGRILKHIKVINSQIKSGQEPGWLALDIANPYTHSLYRYTYGVSPGQDPMSSLVDISFGELCSVIRSDEHVDRDKFVKGLNTGKWPHSQKKKYPSKLAAYGGYNLSDFRLYEPKAEIKMRKKMNKKDSFKFKKKNYQSTVNRRRSRKRGISSMHRVTNKYKP